MLHLLIPIFETRFNIGPHDQNYDIKSNGHYNQPRNFFLLKINKAPLKMILSIYFYSNIFNSGLTWNYIILDLLNWTSKFETKN